MTQTLSPHSRRPGPLVLGLMSLSLGLALATAPAQAAAAENASKAKPAARSKPAQRSHRALRNQAKGLALAQEVVSEINESQLEVATRVLVGRSDCEFKQTVTVEPWDGHPGHFRVTYGKQRFLMVPEDSPAGAVRLEDKRAGTVWLQIPAKSMLMDARRGQRMVDACMHDTQRQALATAEPAGTSLGITGSENTKP